MPDAPAKPPRRVRFSLRSLVLLVLLMAAGLGLWWRWEPWILVSELDPLDPRAQDHVTTRAPDMKRVFERGAHLQDKFVILASNNRVLFRFGRHYYGGGFVTDDQLRLDTGFEMIIDPGRSGIVQPEPPERVEEWRRRRPEWWWGVAWLPEFWLTLVFGAGLAWSLVGDRRRFREGQEKTPAEDRS